MDEYIVFVLRSIWLFILGAGLAVLGLITFLTRPDMGYNPFIIMLMGLFFTGVGSIYGKKKMKQGPSSFSSQERRDFGYQEYGRSESRPKSGFSFGQKSQDSSQQYLGQQAESQEMEAPQQEDATAEREEQFLELAEDNMDSPTTTKPVQQIPQREVVQPQQTMEAEPAIKEESVAQPVIQKPKSGKIIKIIICPKCGSENESDDAFCYKCGKKLLTKKRLAKRNAKVEIPLVKKPNAKPFAKKVVKKVVKKKPVKKTAGKKSEVPDFPGINI